MESGVIVILPIRKLNFEKPCKQENKDCAYNNPNCSKVMVTMLTRCRYQLIESYKNHHATCKCQGSRNKALEGSQKEGCCQCPKRLRQTGKKSYPEGIPTTYTTCTQG